MVGNNGGFLLAYFVWELYGPPKLRTFVHWSLLGLVCLLLPLNTGIGFYKWGRWYDQGMQALEQDLAAGFSLSTLAKEHRDFLIHWWEEDQLAAGMQMLHDAGLGPFAQIPE